MKYDLYKQFSPKDRALMLLNKYPLEYNKTVINGLIFKSRQNNEIDIANYWNEVAKQIKLILKHNNYETK